MIINIARRLKRTRMKTGAAIELGWGITFGLALLGMTIFQGALSTYDPMQSDLLNRFAAPGTEAHWLGSDNLGRDLWSRALAGLEWSLSAALIATVLAATIGTTLGLVAAESQGRTRAVIRQLVDLVLAFPGLVAAICVIAVVGQGFWPLVLTLGLLSWPVFARVTYAESLGLMERDYVLAARLMGVGRWRILIGHVLPGLRATLMVMLAFHFADMLIAESALSFLGLAAPLGEPTWGNMLAESRAHLFRAPWMLFVPAAAIVLAVVTANVIGDGMAAASRGSARGIDL
jgi:peptide/nickel transport system permease protein